MKSYNVQSMKKSGFKINTSVEGEPIELKIERIVNNKEPIKDGAPIIFTERKEGIRPSTNIRTDRFLIAVEASDKIAKSYKAKREERQKPKEEGDKKDGKTESIQGESGKTDTK